MAMTMFFCVCVCVGRPYTRDVYYVYKYNLKIYTYKQFDGCENVLLTC